ncbi:KOW domain-containing RNA-binding protein [Thermosyntropha sp.]|uniref:KOW domain-containing RNA-binding protein n=1 Tax=Thermosyntropha sp. TaxID=2740820 RepID=UPI0025D6D8CF|nr:KOW domain-containing RNA-binding protein [Thermosyntropha sp.]MBO8158062.1 RNA-binding protein [Thermosyntropha sp.]
MDDRIGKVVFSKAGRDKGRMFVVVGVVNNNFCLLADGDLRKIENPKLKNSKHLQFTNIIAEDVMAYLKEGKVPENHVIRKNLKKIGEARERDGKEV